MMQGAVTAVVVSVRLLIGAMESAGLSEDQIDEVSEALIDRNVVAVDIADVASILRAAHVPARKILLLQARLTDANMNSPTTAILDAVPVAEAARQVHAVCVPGTLIIALLSGHCDT
jgi:hypothetical protein